MVFALLCKILNANLACRVMIIFARSIGQPQCTALIFAPVLQNGIINCSRLAPRYGAGKSGISPRLRRLVWTGPRRIKCTLPLLHNFLQCTNRASGCIGQRSIWNDAVHPVHTTRSNHMFGCDVRVRLQLNAAPVVLTALIQPT